MMDETAPRIDGVLEAAIYAKDLDAAEAFYGGVLGLEKVLRAGNRHVFYKCGSTILLIFNPMETVHPPAPDALPVPPHGALGPGHVCFSMTSDAIDAMCGRLADAAIDIEADFRWPNGARSVYFRDPDGNSLELAEPKLWYS